MNLSKKFPFCYIYVVQMGDGSTDIPNTQNGCNYIVHIRHDKEEVEVTHLLYGVIMVTGCMAMHYNNNAYDIYAQPLMYTPLACHLVKTSSPSSPHQACEASHEWLQGHLPQALLAGGSCARHTLSQMPAVKVRGTVFESQGHTTHCGNFILHFVTTHTVYI